VHDGMTVERFRKKFPEMAWPVTWYTEIISQRKKTDGSRPMVMLASQPPVHGPQP
jgi:hypothetical protein